MLYHLLWPLYEQTGFILFNLFGYVTFRAAGSMATALFISLAFGPGVIRWLRRLRVGQVVREEGPQSHLQEAGTPTMGGALIIMSTVAATLLWGRLDIGFTIIALLVTAWLGALGFLDDYLKVVRRRTEGLVGKYKLVGQAVLGFLLGIALLRFPLSEIEPTWTSLPFFAD